MRSRVEFYKIKINSDEKLKWVYSAEEFEKLLIEEIQGQKLIKVFVSLFGYLDSSKFGEMKWDFSYLGGTLLVVFNKSVLELLIHGEGMIQYRIFPAYELEYLINGRIDYPPSDIGIKGDPYYYDISKEFDDKCFGAPLKTVEVIKTDSYPFEPSSFDEKLAQEAEKKGDLPSSVDLGFENNVTLRLVGDPLENFYMEIDE